jgi:Spy/CpxP family protein refolding chaperone
MMKKILYGVVVAALLLQPGWVLAQPARPKGPRDGQRREQIEKRIQTMKIWKLTDELQLSEEQASKFFPLMSEMDRKMDELDQKRMDIVRGLGDLVWEEKADAGKINALLDDLEKLDREQAELRMQFRRDAAKVLKPDQVGKMILFNMRFPEIVRDTIREFDDRPPHPPRFDH